MTAFPFFETDLVRLGLIYGIIISLFVYSRYGVTTGGAITPGYLGLFILRPSNLVVTLMFAAGTYLIVHKILRPRFMLWGRKLFESEILVTLGLQVVWISVLLLSERVVPDTALFYGIGFLIPAIIAHDMGRQGMDRTLLVAVLSAIAVFSLVIITRSLGLFPDGGPAPTRIDALAELAYPVELLLLGIVFSVAVNMLLYRNKVFGALRTGGFVTAAYLALVMTRPADLLFISVCSAVTYLAVTRLLKKEAILFGRTKLAAMVLVAMIVTWAGELLLFTFWDYVPWAGFNAITPMVVALLANDAERQTPYKAAAGAGLSALFVFFAMNIWVFFNG